jgi:hypothetical protein
VRAHTAKDGVITVSDCAEVEEHGALYANKKARRRYLRACDLRGILGCDKEG